MLIGKTILVSLAAVAAMVGIALMLCAMVVITHGAIQKRGRDPIGTTLVVVLWLTIIGVTLAALGI